jgi:hypothetical protein
VLQPVKAHDQSIIFNHGNEEASRRLDLSSLTLRMCRMALTADLRHPASSVLD